jgi:hypothetical protein
VMTVLGSVKGNFCIPGFSHFVVSCQHCCTPFAAYDLDGWVRRVIWHVLDYYIKAKKLINCKIVYYILLTILNTIKKPYMPIWPSPPLTDLDYSDS